MQVPIFISVNMMRKQVLLEDLLVTLLSKLGSYMLQHVHPNHLLASFCTDCD